MTEEFAVFWTAYPEEPHRAGFTTREQAQSWIDECAEMGMNVSSFYIALRKISDWQRD